MELIYWREFDEGEERFSGRALWVPFVRFPVLQC